jgi:hypothetical protein
LLFVLDLMPRAKPCQHHLRHVNAVNLPKGRDPVSSELLKFMRDRDEILNLNVRWLCPKCFTLETRELRKTHQMKSHLDDLEGIEHIESDQHDTDNESSEENVSSQSSCLTSSSSRKSFSSSDGLYELSYKQEKAKDKLARIFEVLDLPPIHDQ